MVAVIFLLLLQNQLYHSVWHLHESLRTYVKTPYWEYTPSMRAREKKTCALIFRVHRTQKLRPVTIRATETARSMQAVAHVP